MLRVRNLTAKDFQFAIRLTDTMSWNLSKEDFEFMLNLEPNGCFVLTDDTKRIGIVTTVSFGRLGWFGNLIVTEDQRGKGAGSLLTKHALKYLTRNKVETVGLYAYVHKIPFYERLGFKKDLEFTVLRGKGFSTRDAADVREATEKDIRDVVNLDRACFGASRQRLLEPILLNSNNPSHVVFEGGELIGYALAKAFGDMAELGPVVCVEGRNDVAVSLLGATLNKLKGSEIYVCMPRGQCLILNTLTKAGFTEDFRVERMFLGPHNVNDCLYVAESLERG